jgi:hypothetical protein
MQMCGECRIAALLQRSRELRTRSDDAREHGDLVMAELLERALVRLLRLRVHCARCGQRHISWLDWLASAPNTNTGGERWQRS